DPRERVVAVNQDRIVRTTALDQILCGSLMAVAKEERHLVTTTAQILCGLLQRGTTLNRTPQAAREIDGHPLAALGQVPHDLVEGIAVARANLQIAFDVLALQDVDKELELQRALA